jgi:type I restriction enzyme S subunit
MEERLLRKIGTVPKLRFGGFNGDWKQTTLEDVTTNVQYGLNAAAKEYDGVNGYLRITDIDEASRTFAPDPITSPSGALDSSCLLKEGDLTFARTGASVGKCYKYKPEDGRLFFAGFLIRFTVLPSADTYFVYSQTFTDRYAEWVKVTSMRSGQPGINAEEYKSYSFNVPTLHEQQKIAAFLGAVDRKIQQLKRKQALLEQYKKGVVQQLFAQELRFKREDGGEYPEWEEKRLGDILTIGSGRDYKHLGKGDIPVFGTGGYMLSVDQALYDGETVFIGRKGTIDKPFYFKGKFWTVDTLFYTHQYRGVIPQFVLALFQRINWREHNEASGVPSLSKAIIERLTVELPCIEEQTRIAGFLMALDAKVAGVAQAVVACQTWKKGLLQQMFV